MSHQYVFTLKNFLRNHQLQKMYLQLLLIYLYELQFSKHRSLVSKTSLAPPRICVCNVHDTKL